MNENLNPVSFLIAAYGLTGVVLVAYAVSLLIKVFRKPLKD
jgi:hypothetical protein